MTERSGPKPNLSPRTGKTGRRTGKASVRGGGRNVGRLRAAELRRSSLSRRYDELRNAMAHEAFLPGMITAAALVVGLFALIFVSRSTVALSPGQVAKQTWTVRVPFEVPNIEETQRRRDEQRRYAPRAYLRNSSAMNALRQDLVGLPQLLETTATFEELLPEVRERSGIDSEERFAAARAALVGEGAKPADWSGKVDRFIEGLLDNPLLDSEEYQRVQAGLSQVIVLVDEDGSQERVSRTRAINMDPVAGDAGALQRGLRNIAESAGVYPEAEVRLMIARTVHQAFDLLTFDAAVTAKLGDDESAKVELIAERLSQGQVLFLRGEVLDADDIRLAERELSVYRSSMTLGGRAAELGGGLFVALGVVGALVWYVSVYARRIVVRPWRAASLAVLMGGGVSLAVWIALTKPGLEWLALSLPTTLVAMVCVIAYDRRLSLVVSGLTALVIGVALGLGGVTIAAMLAGAMVAAWRLTDVRSRVDVVRASMLVALALSLSAGAAVVLDLPLTPAVLRAAGGAALYAGLGGFAAGAITLFALPLIERVFNVVTGMTLSELRDPRQPLLRELQQRAPGTYNHSLNVATIAEAAAAAINADGAHAYVGALYHDIGKMSKPEYFVENQHRGFNRHNKLSPAMSLLVIVGHVKDGVELAREFGLPRSLHHYIESHHGTTLVEYFYNRARERADAGESEDTPREVEYRYPGPKPRTREAAILMLCDAVESATRAMNDPTPSRIGALVRELSNKRLMDGQFEESNLTLRELHVVEQTLTKALCSVYHGRIKYPSAKAGGGGEEARQDRGRPAAAQGGA